MAYRKDLILCREQNSPNPQSQAFIVFPILTNTPDFGYLF
jgi:hypothetical protein